MMVDKKTPVCDLLASGDRQSWVYDHGNGASFTWREIASPPRVQANPTAVIPRVSPR